MNKGDFKAIKLLHPNKEILLSFDKQTKSIFEKALTFAKQNQELIQLRDWLLPMLMNGQVKVQ